MAEDPPAPTTDETSGDGEFFKLPFEPNALAWWEEISELLFLSSYLVGFVLVHLDGCKALRPDE